MPAKDVCPGGIITCFGQSIGCSYKDSGNRVVPGITPWVRIGFKLPEEPDLETRLFNGFAYGGLLKGFSVINESPRQGPAQRLIFPFN